MDFRVALRPGPTQRFTDGSQMQSQLLSQPMNRVVSFEDKTPDIQNAPTQKPPNYSQGAPRKQGETEGVDAMEDETIPPLERGTMDMSPALVSPTYVVLPCTKNQFATPVVPPILHLI